MQVGLVVMDEDPADALTIVRAADRAGIHSLWSIDYYNRSSLTRAAAFAAVSETAIVGTSVTPLFARAPLALAAAAADVQGIAGGRFVLGVGSSTRRMNQDWYGTALRHPAPQVRERIELIRRLTAHRSGPFRYEGQFDQVSMAHYDRTALPDSLTILAAGVGEHMVRVAGECADGFVGHTIASAGYLRDTARPLLAEGAARAGRDVAGLRMTTQIVAAASSDPRAARRDAAAQVGFYSTPKGYDALFPDGQFAAERIAAREALARGDVAGVIAAGDAMVEERAVFGAPEDVAGQLRRYADVVDWAILYPPHFGVDPERIHANELSLVEVASGWTSLCAQPKRVRIVTFDVIDPGQQGVEILGHAEVTTGQPVRVAAGQREDQASRLLRVGAAAGGELVAYPAVDTAFWRLLAGSAPQRDLTETDGQQAGVHAEH
jgi:alkanesulfonate monooxygenase SsuD/methylene tetrahydromethanopterin reductase-like flavin-dependent oxidoreductase (luciferase family)